MLTKDAFQRMRGQPRPAPAALATSQRSVDEHATRVMGYACLLARTLRLSSQMVAEIRHASLLHDIGKRALPDALLNKTAPLTSEEWRLIRTHPEVGCALAQLLGHDDSVRSLIRHHHEHWDGSGYPYGLQEAAIPVGARVIAIADVFDALTSPRSYRVALDASAALAVMHAEAGTVLDPHLFAAFEQLIEKSLRRNNRWAERSRFSALRFRRAILH
jgi:putative nucleotidyltransferase with HDIG domain